jgi:transcriptional regulator with XRE-family HTH domain
MTDWSMQRTERDLSQMLGDYLRARSSSAKQLARKIGCDPRTAEGFRAGRHWPQARHWPGIIAAFGRDVTDAIFHPDAARARLEEEVRALEAQLAERRAALGVVGKEDRSFGARPAGGLAADDGP